MTNLIFTIHFYVSTSMIHTTWYHEDGSLVDISAVPIARFPIVKPQPQHNLKTTNLSLCRIFSYPPLDPRIRVFNLLRNINMTNKPFPHGPIPMLIISQPWNLTQNQTQEA